jgi:DNA-binding protein HU-beta
LEKRMNKQQLIEAVAKILDIPVTWAAAPTEAVLDAIAREMAAGGSVTVTGFGTFDSTKTEARLARNPQNGDPVHISARVRPRFRPGQNLQELVNGDRKVPLDGSAIRKAPKGSLTGGAR